MPNDSINPFASPTASTDPVLPELTLADLPEGCLMATADATVLQAEPILDLKFFAQVTRIKLSLFLGFFGASCVSFFFLYFLGEATPMEKWLVLPVTFITSPLFIYISQDQEGFPFDFRLAKRLLLVRNLGMQTRRNIRRNFFVIEEFPDDQYLPTLETMLDAGLVFLDKDQGLTLEGAHYHLCVPWDGIYLCELVEPKRWTKKAPLVRLILRLAGGPFEIFLRPGIKPLLSLNFSDLKQQRAFAQDLHDRITSMLIASRDTEKPHPTVSSDNHSSSESASA
ncbi:hypothetical protein DTL42_23305 [Bremerella cremea]|uniref:Uncharacterized protein n=1 Tax=Bremerella cremea TaxID=1031537 RepID=A0A368KNR2_9BACT|nr:hypothetical protein [Bremerella cremea]RCS41482.1 hypothetical protein DTL42_23305 [Bremerella cremea]